MKKICVIGLGYIGLPTAALLADAGFSVLGYDIDKEKIAELKSKTHKIKETGLNDLIKKVVKNNCLSFSSTVFESDVYIICVPTPLQENKMANIDMVLSAAEKISPLIKKDDLIILESTVPPKTTANKLVWALLKNSEVSPYDIKIAYCPERAIPGNTIFELINNDRIIGGVNDESGQEAKKIYQKFVKGNIFITKSQSAEMVKIVENAYRDLNIAFANEIALISENIGADVWKIIELANKHPRVNILNPGPGVGGHCIPIDPYFLSTTNRNSKLINTARKINDLMPENIVNNIVKITKNISKPKISLLGLSYKENTDDTRGAPAISIGKNLENLGFSVSYHDPLVKNFPTGKNEKLFDCLQNSDCIVFLLNHSEFQKIRAEKILPIIRTPIVYDTRNMIDTELWQKSGFFVKTLGRDSKNSC